MTLKANDNFTRHYLELMKLYMKMAKKVGEKTLDVNMDPTKEEQAYIIELSKEYGVAEDVIVNALVMIYISELKSGR